MEYGSMEKPKYEVTRVDNVSMENSSTDMQ